MRTIQKIASILFLSFVFTLVFGTIPVAHSDEVKRRPLEETLYELLKKTHVAAPPPGWTETAEELDLRLHQHAIDAAAVAKGNASEALLILAVAEHESGFSIDVDKGPCYRGKDGKSERCDSGHAACEMQVHGGNPDRLAALFADRQECYRTALRELRRVGCTEFGPDYRFALYAAGDCVKGAKGSAELVGSWRRWKQNWNVELAREIAEDNPTEKDKVAGK
jgi:hypothetical protein